MRYLKEFNESFRAPSSFREEIQDFCENCLAYLIDEDFSIETNVYGLDPVSISFVLIRRFEGEVEPISFSWNEVKDYYIPFLQMLLKKYNVVNSSKSKIKNSDDFSWYPNNEVQVVIRTSDHSPSDSVYYSLYEALEDKINPYDKIVYIKILITEK